MICARRRSFAEATRRTNTTGCLQTVPVKDSVESTSCSTDSLEGVTLREIMTEGYELLSNFRLSHEAKDRKSSRCHGMREGGEDVSAY